MSGEESETGESKSDGQFSPEFCNEFMKFISSFHDDKVQHSSQAFTAHMADMILIPNNFFG